MDKRYNVKGNYKEFKEDGVNTPMMAIHSVESENKIYLRHSPIPNSLVLSYIVEGDYNKSEDGILGFQSEGTPDINEDEYSIWNTIITLNRHTVSKVKGIRGKWLVKYLYENSK